MAIAFAESRAFAVLALALLIVLAYYERTRAINASYWIDEGISIGIAKHSFLDIPGVLRQDGSPPLYYMLLHVWTELFGTREVVTHQLSLGFTLLSIPAAYWAASVWGRGPALAGAAVAAFSPFLGVHAIETRMYALVVLLGLLAAGAFVRGFVMGRRRYVALFAVLLAALVYTHNWGAFFAVGAGIGILAIAALRRDRGVLRDGVLAAGGALALYAPWIPSVLYQAEHTGAPWSQKPDLSAFGDVFETLIGSDLMIALLAVVAAGGLAWVFTRGRAEERHVTVAFGVALVVSMVLAYIVVQITPGWAARYFAIFMPPLLMLLALGVGRARVVGVLAIAVFAAVSWNPITPSPYFKSNAEAVANEVNPSLRAGDVLLSTQPEQVPLLRHYLVDGLVYADPIGFVRDPRVTDWRDILERMRAAKQPASIEPVLSSVRPGRRLVLVRPIIRSNYGWRAPWTKLVRQRSLQVTAALRDDPRFRAVDVHRGLTLVRSRRVGVVAVEYVRVRD